MKESSWQTKKRIEADYSSSMMKLANFFFSKAVENASSYDEQLSVLRSTGDRPEFLSWAKAAARKMITGLYAANTTTWREAASEGTEGKKIHTILFSELKGVTGAKVREIINSNAELISSLPLTIAERVTKVVQQLSASGLRYEEISKVLVKKKLVNKLTKQHIALIARTETSKATTALTKARSEDIGLDWYMWRTSKDGRVRNSHRHMDGVLISWSEAPAPELLAGIKSKLGHYHAGDAPNDRCYPEPIISLDQVQWPHKVYYGGKIQMMTRSKFDKISGTERMAA